MNPTAFVISRDAIGLVERLAVGGQVHELGEHRDFRRNAALAKFLPDYGRMSVSWTRLRAGQVLAPHVHPIKSMVVVVKGAGYLTGDLELIVTEGDVVAVPSGALHGFRTDHELIALSLQFEGSGLYEVNSSPRVAFGDPLLKRLMDYQTGRLDRHVETPVFHLLRDGTLIDEKRRWQFYSALHQWSRAFQKLIFLRQGLVSGQPWESLFLGHFKEELGHDLLLKKSVGAPLRSDDAALDALSSWFLHSMLTGNNSERLVIVHLVLERAAQAFHGLAKEVCGGDYFSAHAAADDDHCTLGLAELAGMNNVTCDRLLDVSARAWDVLEMVMDRIVQLVRQPPPRDGSERHALQTVLE